MSVQDLVVLHWHLFLFRVNCSHIISNLSSIKLCSIILNIKRNLGMKAKCKDSVEVVKEMK